MDNELMNQGVMLMLVGMATVFVFLTTLVFATTLMSRLLLRLAPMPDADAVSDQEVAAITAAIRRHRDR